MRAALVSDDPPHPHEIEGKVLGNGDVFVQNGERAVIENLDSIPFPNYGCSTWSCISKRAAMGGKQAGVPILRPAYRHAGQHCTRVSVPLQLLLPRVPGASVPGTRSAENIIAEIKELQSI